MSAKNTFRTSTEVPPPSTFNRMSDTTSEAELVRLAAIRAMAPAARLRQAIALSEQMRRLTLAGLRRRHPELTDRELVSRLSEIRDEVAVVRSPSQRRAS